MSLVSPRLRSGAPMPVRVKRPSERRSISRTAVRALDVLEYLGDCRRPVRAVEIARHLGIHPSSTNQLLKSMVDAGHLRFEARAMTYVPSSRLVGFARWILELHGPDDRLRSLLHKVRDELGLITTLTTPNDVFMQVLDVAVPDGLSIERGQRVSMFGSATGSAYLSTLDPGEIGRLAYRARIPDGEIERVLESVAEIRREGVADGPNESGASSDPMWSIAVPLPSVAPFPVVLGIAGPYRQVLDDRDRLRLALRRAVESWTEAGEPMPSRTDVGD